MPSVIPNSFSRHIPFCNFCCQTSCRLCHRFGGDPELNASTLLPPPLFLNPFFAGPAAVAAALPEAHFTTSVTPLSVNRFVDGAPLQEFVDDDFRTELHPTLYPGAEIQLLSQNPQLLQPAEHSQLPYILVAGGQEEILGESAVAKHSPETLQLVLLNPASSTSSSPQSVNTLSGFGQLLSTVPANLELVQMVKKLCAHYVAFASLGC